MDAWHNSALVHTDNTNICVHLSTIKGKIVSSGCKTWLVQKYIAMLVSPDN